ncbi:hypothetical protein GCM10025858_26080 [Alicyclobacillus sacchari]|uniref:transposase n=1 Tax=Alicyclobacillus sacchari TaxID=392010 RepID=UPI0023E9E27B|nr:transposase [Alicyclobacillus sacchari]GMA58105.1 hypothetical protein GCM10025858_26080 [Alicyclobacillus sacchari]
MQCSWLWRVGSASQVAQELGVSQKTLYGWMAKYKEDPSTPLVCSGNLKPETKALRDLERKIRELREENAILKAVRIFTSDGSKIPIHPQIQIQISGSEDVQNIGRVSKLVLCIAQAS